MKFKVDENMPAETADLLRSAGYEAETVKDEGLSEADDAVLAARLQNEGCAFVTLDLDFSNIHAYPPQDYQGIVVIRPKRQDKNAVLALAQRLSPCWQPNPWQTVFGLLKPTASGFVRVQLLENGGKQERGQNFAA